MEDYNNYFLIARRLGCRLVRRSNKFQSNILLINAIGDCDFRITAEHFVRFVIRRQGVRKMTMEKTVVLYLGGMTVEL
jgi:hypothetical protein